MKIPGLFAEKCKKFPIGSSFDHIQDVCEDIGLGFASNETSSDDIMARLMPFETYETFIEETIGHAYKDDNSFWTWYVDPYYYLCMVNINKQFSTEDKLEDVNISMVTPPSGQPNEEQTKDTIKGKLMLTNRSDRAGTNIYIENWSQDKKSAQTWINHGYKRYSQYFSITDENATEYVSTFVDPLTTEGAENDAIIQKGRPKDEFYKSQVKYKYFGKQSSDNVHENYIFSKLLNFQNLEEIKKVSLNVDMAGMNFYIYRYMRIPVIVYESAGRGANRISKIIGDLPKCGCYLMPLPIDIISINQSKLN
jgi:hypothetical protein